MKPRAAILTGSRLYGSPRPDSDLDLVVLVSRPALGALKGQADEFDGVEYAESTSLRFGPLNLICVTDPTVFDMWLKGTAELYRRRPVLRDEAKAYFDDLRASLKG